MVRTNMREKILLFATLLLMALACPVSADDPIPEKVSFNFHVRPILSENCFFCHGPDANQRQADLRLDTAMGAEASIETGSPDDSELIARILSDDPDLLMPPPDSGRKISNREKEILKRWVEQGAEYETHWAYVKVERPAVPKVEHESWGRNSIDRFVLAKLEAKGIAPSPRAEARVLVRRLYLDLIGLPPTPEQSKSFVADYKADANGAIESLVGRGAIGL